MRGKHTIVINGRHYDAITGLPADTPAAENNTIHVHTAPKVTVTETSDEKHHVAVSHTAERAKNHLQHHPHKSSTLRRDIVKKPASTHHEVVAKAAPVRAQVAKSPLVSKFAPHPSMSEVKRVAPAATHVAQSHVVAAAHHKAAVRHQQPVAKSSRELKDHLIKQQLDQAPTKKKETEHKKAKAPLRVSSVMAACFGIMVLGGYLSYINMPNLSVRVAASQAGINAQYPGYTPSGYSFDGPVSFSNGQVMLSFKGNGGTGNYKINQQKSGWDSQAVLDNYVAAKTDDYDVNDTQGLTIYTYDNNAAWVNKGVLYTISGDAPLRTEQVLKIATSL